MNKGQCQQDLLTDSECSAGIEADFVISLGSKNVCAYMSRCRGQFVHIDEHQGIWFRMNSCCEWFVRIIFCKVLNIVQMVGEPKHIDWTLQPLVIVDVLVNLCHIIIL